MLCPYPVLQGCRLTPSNGRWFSSVTTSTEFCVGIFTLKLTFYIAGVVEPAYCPACIPLTGDVL